MNKVMEITIRIITGIAIIAAGIVAFAIALSFLVPDLSVMRILKGSIGLGYVLIQALALLAILTGACYAGYIQFRKVFFIFKYGNADGRVREINHYKKDEMDKEIMRNL